MTAQAKQSGAHRAQEGQEAAKLEAAAVKPVHTQHDRPAAGPRRGRNVSRVHNGVPNEHRHSTHTACQVERRVLLNLRDLGRQKGRELAQHRQRGARRAASPQVHFVGWQGGAAAPQLMLMAQAAHHGRRAQRRH